MTDDATIWENEVYLAQKWREKIAYRVAFGFFLLALVSLIGSSALLNLRSVEYVTLTVDRQTGDLNIDSIVNTVDVSEDAVLAEAFVYEYVLDRETYDFHDQKRRINEIYETFTTGRAQQELVALYDRSNPLNPIEKYGSQTTIDVTINSIELLEPTLAQVRLTKEFTVAKTVTAQRYIVTIRFFSDLAKVRTKEFRRKNPVAFFVEEYRISPEVG